MSCASPPPGAGTASPAPSSGRCPIAGERPNAGRRSVCLGALAWLSAGGTASGGTASGAAAERIVSLELVLTETLIALGAPPIANANNPLYAKLVGDPPLPTGIVDIGPPQEPNLEFLQQLSPDAILLTEWQAAIASTVGRVAPVRLVRTVKPAQPPVATIAEVTREVAALVGRAGRAEDLLLRLGEGIRSARDCVAGIDRPVGVIRFSEDGRHVAVFGTRSMVGGMVEAIGLRNAWTGRQNAVGTVLVPIEDLAGMAEAILVHFDRGEETRRALRRLDTNPLWLMLPFGKAGRLVTVPVVHPNGGIASARRFAAQLAEALPRAAAHAG